MDDQTNLLEERGPGGGLGIRRPGPQRAPKWAPSAHHHRSHRGATVILNS